MAEGLIGNLLQTVQGLQEMDRRKRADEQAIAQQAVDNAFKQHSLDIQEKGIQQNNYWKQQLDENRDANLAERTQHDRAIEVLQKQVRDRLDRSQEETARKNKQGEAYKAWSGAPIPRAQALGAAGYTEQDAMKELENEANTQNIGIRAGNARLPSQNESAAQALSAYIGTPVSPAEVEQYFKPKPLLTAEDVAQQVNPIAKQQSDAREALEKLREQRKAEIAQRMTEFAEMEGVRRAKQQAELDRINIQNQVSVQNYFKVGQDITRANAKFEWQKYIDQGRLDLAKANLDLAKLRDQRAAAASQRADQGMLLRLDNERKGYEILTRQYSNDAKNTYLAFDKEYQATKGLHDKAAALKANLLIRKWDAQKSGKPNEWDQTDEDNLMKAEADLAQNPQEKVKQLKAQSEAAYKEWSTAQSTNTQAKNLFSNVMSQKGTLAPQRPSAGTRTMPIGKDLIIRVKSVDEARKLPRGTIFLDPNGVRRVVP